MSRVHAEGQDVGDHAGFLYGGRGSAALWHGVKISVESATVQLHKIQDSCGQFFDYFGCNRKKVVLGVRIRGGQIMLYD